MARQQETKRFDGRLDTLLRRNLPPSEYERVVTTEPCVVVTPEGKRAPRHVVLGHRQLYFTEIPPKSLSKALRLEDAVSVETVDDEPDFLSQKDRQKTVHVRVLYQRKVKDKAILPSVTQSRRSPRILRQIARRTTEIAGDSDHTSATTSTRTSPGGKRTTAVGSPLLISTKRDTFKHTSSSRDHPPAPTRTPPPPLHSSTLLSDERQTQINTPYLSSTRGTSGAAGLLSRPQQEQLSKSTGSLDKVSPDKQTGLKLGEYRGSLGNICSSLDERGLRERLLLAHGEKWSSTLSLGLSELAMEEEGGDGEERESVRVETVPLEIYVLKDHTYFHRHFANALEDYRIECCCQAGTAQTNSDSQSYSDKHQAWSEQYQSLRSELLHCRKLDTSAKLLLELTTACQRYFTIKSLFWSDCDVLEYCINQLRTHCVTEKLPLVDSIDYAAIVMELLLRALQGTYSCNKRFLILTRSNGELLEPLTAIIITTVTHQHQRHRSLVHLSSHTTSSDEVSKLLGELTDYAVGVLYELSRVAQQVSWQQCGSSATIVWWVDHVLATNSSTTDCLHAVVTQLSTSLESSVPAEQAVSLYYSVSLMLVAVQQSTSLRDVCRQHFTEEFRYYLRPALGQGKLPSGSPLHTVVTTRLQLLCSLILDR